MSDLINRQNVLDVLRNLAFDYMFQCGEYYGEDERQLTIINAKKAIDVIEAIPSAKPNNQVHLCNSCKYGYPECPAEMSDIIFGNGKGHDNVCACAKFEIKPERTTRVEYIAEVYKDEIVDHYLSGICGICGESTYDRAKYCSECGAKLDWSENE